MGIRTLSLGACIALAAGLLSIVAAPALAAFSLTVGTFPRQEAEEIHQRLSGKGYPVYLLYGENCEVRLGGFETYDKAQEVADRLETEEKVIARIIEEEERDLAQFSWEEDAEGETEAEADEGTGTEANQDSFARYKDEQAKKIISLGLDLFGHPYKYGGTKIGQGIDCSFFSQTIFKGLGIRLPRTSGEQFKVGREVQLAELKVGDLIFFRKTYYSKRKKNGRRSSVTRINHVGIYIGNGEFIHATLNGMRVTISRIGDAYYMKRFAGARRVLPEN
jgi:cell wall-associated NlpC family hydrolase